MEIILSLIPVLIFLICLVLLDSFKLIDNKFLIVALSLGLASAGISFYVNSFLLQISGLRFALYSIFWAPVIEEVLKISMLFIIIRVSRASFVIDGAIYGFAVGSGFALLENIFYLYSSDSTNMLLWVVRGFGTAVMHGGTIAIAGIIAMILLQKKEQLNITMLLPGLILAYAIHALFNSFYIDPVNSTIIIVVLVPAIFFITFRIGSNNLKEWMNLELDSESMLLSEIRSGNFSGTKAGKYILNIKNRFAPEIVFDMICYIELFTELSVRAKGIMLLKETGMDIPEYPDIDSKLKELKFLEGSIGKTGIMALKPILRFSSKDLWKINLLKG